MSAEHRMFCASRPTLQSLQGGVFTTFGHDMPSLLAHWLGRKTKVRGGCPCNPDFALSHPKKPAKVTGRSSFDPPAAFPASRG
ncbi:hypothetical protein NL676_025032 [Syzygium grande]|nr:hypothetical protein NL676_025032 [Syzygium grande]